jgi:signal transduction histidine kinase
MASAETMAPAAPPVRLAVKLACALLAVMGLMILFLVAWLGPQTTRSFVAQCDAIVSQNSSLMHRLAREQTESSRKVLVDTVEHTTDARGRTLTDLPVALFGGDLERMRAALQTQDAERAARILRNMTVLAGEMQRRAETQIKSHLAAVEREQRGRSEEFAQELRGSHLMVSTAVLGLLILVLGLGLYQLVVQPVAALRAATHQVTLGHLDVSVASRSNDEVGALAADFATMIQQLRASRAELTRLNRDLEQQVADQTRQLVHAAKMASVGTLAGGVAHEFNNLIGGIRGCANELLQDTTDTDARETLGVILRAADRATGITQQLLRFARPAVNRTAAVDAATVLDDALRLVEPEGRRRQLKVERRFQHGLSLHADPDALHQVFVNLFTNAMQAMTERGTLTVAADRDADGIAIRVTDTGTGIALEDIDHVFEPFFTRKDHVRDPSQRGSGLGLSVSYGIVAAHGGRMTVTSRQGEGSTFTVWLPVAPGAGPT